MKRTIKLLALVFSVALMAAMMAVPVFATASTTDVWPSSTAAYQVQNAASAYASTGAVTVRLNVHSKKVNGSSLDKHYAVTVGDSSTGSRSVTVRDILIQAMANDPNLVFQMYDGTTMTSSDSGFYKISYNGTTYSPTALGARNGWMFRVNKKLVLLSGTPGDISAWGSDISDTYVMSGYMVDVYMDDVDSESAAANFPRVQSVTYDPSTKKLSNVHVDYSKDWFVYDDDEEDYIWNINSFANLSGATVNVYNSSGEVIATGTTDSNGNASLNATLSVSSSYRIQVESTFRNDGYFNNMHSQIHWITNSSGGGSWTRY